jgi:hypothetical protein
MWSLKNDFLLQADWSLPRTSPTTAEGFGISEFESSDGG